MFGTSASKFLGFLVFQRGIEADPDQISALLKMRTPQSRNDIQCLNGRLVALNRFISKASDRCLPFFKALRGNGPLVWTPQCKSAFMELKAYLGSPELLSTPHPGETLYLYLGVSENAISSALIREVDKVQKPV